MISLIYLPVVAVVSTILYFGVTTVYNVFFHPLREYPGPFLSKATRLVWSYHGFNGTLLQYITQLHEKYGEVVRIAPDELSYNTAQAWTDIYGHRTPNGNGNLPKEVSKRRKDFNGVPSMISADEPTHRRMRRLQAHMFAEKALAAQESLIKEYVDLLISKLHEKAASPATNVLNMVLWYNYTTFDILGSLAFGEDFSCLRSDDLHPWIANMWRSLKDGSFVRVSKQFSWPFDKLVYALAPAELKIAQKVDYDFASGKARTRMAQGDTDRADFMSYILKHNDEKGMTTGEIESNAGLLILAGSETTATFLSGITYNLLRTPEVLKTLTELVRNTFASQDDITLLGVQRLEYFTACLEEGLRTYPPVPAGMPRVSQGNMINNKYVTAGTIVSVHQWASYSSPRNFADPEKFVPERWMKEPPARYANDHTKVFQPFSFGPRNCIGRNLAYAEMRLILARVLWNFDLELQPGAQDWSAQKSYVLWEKGPLPVKLVPREF
ncbi:Cytochrome P450 monooxygenase aclL [Lachnellula cervina]|uniref:Cytochrome P450 monooxygenase aclL n=1 Tax=Lachnellula cervina TaxID=1316786 RepID=A0A7D8UUF3_9HELO|nr:Cytochrome P450 monooxygenase aclL [Lachnellula cervina]